MRRALVLFLVALGCAVLAAGAGAAAMVETDELRLELNGEFQPRNLPKRSFAPVQFEGRIDVAKPGGGEPPALEQVIVDFDRDGRLQVGGLPTCPPARIAEAGVKEARRLCRGAIVGTGRMEALVDLPSGPVPTRSPLTLFNGPRREGHPTVVFHTRTDVPAAQTYAFVAPILKRRGEFRYRVIVDIPPLAGGLGAITHISVKVGRLYRADGARRSYVSARCSDHILRSHGIFRFAGGLAIEGVGLEKYCAQR